MRLLLAVAVLISGCVTEDECKRNVDRAIRRQSDDCVQKIHALGRHLERKCGKAIDLTAKKTADRMKHLCVGNPTKDCKRDYALGEIGDLLVQVPERLTEVVQFFVRLSKEKDYTMPSRSEQIHVFLKCIFEERIRGRGGIPHVCK